MANKPPPTAEKRNAFAELMSPKPKLPKTTSTSTSTETMRVPIFPNKARDGLGAYIDHPEAFPPSAVIYYNDDFVAINDLFPKSTLHLLLLPRDPEKYHLHPFDAFADADFLRKVRAETQKLKTLAAAELRRKHGRYSTQERAREEALKQDPPPDELPPGRDWERELRCGIHAHPSMNHLHVHVISVDRFSERLKHRKHYNSFSTPFFIDLEDFPLDGDDVRRHPSRQGYLASDFKCWRCGVNFGNKFTKLKEHLAKEFTEWRQE